MDIYMFLKGLEPDDKGRFIHQIWNFSDNEVERTHDFIQKLFPLNEPSQYSLSKYYIDDPKLIEKLRMDPQIIENIIVSMDFMLGFFSRNNQWQYHHNHNQLRITRIIKSLLLLVSRNEAKSFYQNILSYINSDSSIPPIAHDHWRLALDIKADIETS